jgi:hypothetical protein
VAQHDYVIANGTGAAVRSDLNNALAAIVSQNSGATEPATMYAYQWWADTSTGLLKLRNAANNAWITLRELDGTLTIEAGTVSAPGLAFASDLNTGIYSPSADQVAITTNGVERVEWGTSEVVFNDGGTNYDFRIEGDTNSSLFFVDASAEAVGIGTTSPSRLLHLSAADNTSFSSADFDQTYNFLRIVNTTNDRAAGIYFGIGTNGEAAITAAETTDGETALVFGTRGGGARSERARLDHAGRLLVGTSSTSSTALFQVQGNSSSSTGEAIVQLRRGTNNVGIINGNSLGKIEFSNTESTVSAVIEAVADANWNTTNDYPSRLTFSTTADGASSPTERMRIPQNGFTRFSNTGVYTDINSTAHGFRSDGGDWILDNVNANASPYGMIIRYSAASPNGTGNEAFLFSDSTTTRFSVRSNGGITNFSGNNVNLSDINSKKDIAPAAGTWDCLKEWEIVNFRYKDQPDDADLNLGVIAQQVAESCPEVITVFQKAKEATEDHPAQEERLGVKEQQMMWMAIKALQEAQLRIETLEAEVAALKAS